MKTKTIYRNAITGEIVTKAYAKANPETTEKETVKPAPKKPWRRYESTKRGEWARAANCILRPSQRLLMKF
jgi:hypothetical protein